MLVVQALACAFFVLHFYLMGAYTGALMTAVAGVQALLAIPLEKHPRFNLIYLATIPIIFILVGLSWAGLPSIFSGWL